MTLGLASVATVALIASLNSRPLAPKNMDNGGIAIGSDRLADRLGEEIAASKSTDRPKPARIIVYLDYLCPYCKQFEAANGDRLRTLAAAGEATIEVHPIALLTNRSAGTKYSLRAANAAACVANDSPNAFLDFHVALFAHQPEEGTPGLTDSELRDLLPASAADSTRRCIEDGTFVRWVEAETSRAATSSIPGSDVARVVGTPTVVVNGRRFGGDPTNPQSFAAFVEQQSAR